MNVSKGRFGKILAEVEGLTRTCPDCGVLLVRLEMDAEGPPLTLSDLTPMDTCPVCQKTFWRPKHHDESKDT